MMLYRVALNSVAMATVRTFAEASRAVRAYIERRNLGARALHRTCGNVHDDDGRLVARVAYNGTVWPPEARPGLAPIFDPFARTCDTCGDPMEAPLPEGWRCRHCQRDIGDGTEAACDSCGEPWVGGGTCYDCARSNGPRRGER